MFSRKSTPRENRNCTSHQELWLEGRVKKTAKDASKFYELRMSLNPESLGYLELALALRQVGTDLSPEVRNATMAIYSRLHPKRQGATVLRNVAYGPHDRHVCNIFVPTGPAAAPRPMMVFVHGGGFVKGDKELDGTPFYDNIGYWAARHNFIGLTTSYRLAPEFKWPAGGDDVEAILKWLCFSASAYGGDDRQIFLIGHSAGSTHVATCLARLDDDLRSHVAGAILNSGIYDLASAAGSSVDPILESYFGSDVSAYSEMSSLPELSRLNIPLMFTVNEREPTEFQKQGLEAAHEIFRATSLIPTVLTLPGHNHYSSILNVGLLKGDILGEHMHCFMSSVSRPGF